MAKRLPFLFHFFSRLIMGCLMGLLFSPGLRAAEPLKVLRLSPDHALVKRVMSVRISGVMEEKPPQVIIGGKFCTNVILNQETVSCRIPTQAPGAYDVFIHSQDRVLKADGKFYYLMDSKVSDVWLVVMVGKKTTLPLLDKKPPVTTEILAGPGQLDLKEGTFLAPESPGITTLGIKEAQGEMTTYTIQTLPKMTTFPEAQTLSVGDAFQFTPSGGKPPYEVQLISGKGRLFKNERIYIAPPNAGDAGDTGGGGEAVIQITDSLLNQYDLKVTLKPKDKQRQRKLAVGGKHTCAVLSQEVKCWGDHHFSQLGKFSKSMSPIPIAIKGFKGPIQSLVAGAEHSCVIDDTTVKCWGGNRFGQLGNGATQDSDVPVPVLGMDEGVLGIAAGEFHTCALTVKGVSCWGKNHLGQLGVPDKTGSSIPLAVEGLPASVRAIYAGYDRSCATTTEETYCWGNLQWGKTLEKEIKGTFSPTLFKDLGEVNELALGWSHACALMMGGGVKCWGFPDLGGTGVAQPAKLEDQSKPMDVLGLQSGVSDLASGQYHNCVVVNQKLQCWGYNNNGELGDGSRILKRIPLLSTGVYDNATEVSAGVAHSCALLSTGKAVCWGENLVGQIGDGSYVMRVAPVEVIEQK